MINDFSSFETLIFSQSVLIFFSQSFINSSSSVFNIIVVVNHQSKMSFKLTIPLLLFSVIIVYVFQGQYLLHHLGHLICFRRQWRLSFEIHNRGLNYLNHFQSWDILYILFNQLRARHFKVTAADSDNITDDTSIAILPSIKFYR